MYLEKPLPDQLITFSIFFEPGFAGDFLKPERDYFGSLHNQLPVSGIMVLIEPLKKIIPHFRNLIIIWHDTGRR